MAAVDRWGACVTRTKFACCSYLYTDTTTFLTTDNVMQVLYASKKYGVPILGQICATYAKQNASFDNVALLLTEVSPTSLSMHLCFICLVFHQGEHVKPALVSRSFKKKLFFRGLTCFDVKQHRHKGV